MAHKERFLRVKALLARIFVAMLVALVAVLLLDVAVGVLAPDARTAFDRMFPVGSVRHPKPYVMFGGKPGAPVAVRERPGEKSSTLNARGYRGPLPGATKEPNERRIYVLGGSTVFSGTPALSTLLQDELADVGLTHVRVFNLGVVSSVSGMELARIVYEVVDLSPDLVVMYNGNNDLSHPFSWDPRPGYPFNFMAYENHPLLESDVGSYPAITMFLYGSHIARKIGSRQFLNRFVPLAQTQSQAGYGTAAWRQQLSETYVARLIKAKRISSAFGAEFIAFFQPSQSFRIRPEPQVDGSSNLTERTAHFLDCRRRIRALIQALPESDREAIVDLSDSYDEYSGAPFKDHVHTTQAAKPFMATLLAEHIIQRFEARLR
ncbi:MAG: SGNH/GDSL hydrolase family protein [bacterium]|nr:SGNH/GDSL hydrolase family protein [bacterium]